MNPLKIIDKYYQNQEELKALLIDHSQSVTDKALALASLHPELKLDQQFIYEAAMLHDIGIFLTHAPAILCFGDQPYIAHGYLGADLLRQAGYPKHARVCERHTGTGLSLSQITQQKLPLPHRDMQPESLEEQLICFADSFYSKTHLGQEKCVEDIRQKLQRFGQEGVEKFDHWCRLFL
ncbi:MAG: HDIG domain-containing metalloprotein [Bacteroides sp.]